VKPNNFGAVHPGVGGTSGTGTSVGGDLGGSLPGPTVEGIQGIPVDAGPPADGEELVYDAGSGTLVWAAPAGDGSPGVMGPPGFDGADGEDGFRSSSPQVVMGIEFVIDGGGAVLTTGVKGDLEIPFDCTITAARLFAAQSGSVVVNVWKDTYANFPPVVGDKITASAPPTISTATNSEDVTLTGWTTSIVAGDVLRFNVDSVTTITRVTISLTVVRA
jgi:hypothetical protein